MINHRYFAVASLVLLCGILGCSTNVPFGGRVTFSDDGSPLTEGIVCFETNTFLARGQLDKNGCYDLGTYGAKDGIPKGEYRVYITAAMKSVGADAVLSPGQEGYNPAYAALPPSAPLLDKKYDTGQTSGLTATIDGTTKTFDFQVDRYKP